MIIAGILAFFANKSFPETDFDGLLVTFVDVGQGDCTFIKTPGGKTVLIDCGEGDAFKMQLRPFLKSHNTRRIDYLIGTHYHSDHIGGAEEVFEEFEVQNLVIPGHSPQNSRKKALIKAANDEGTKIYQLYAGDNFPKIDEGINISVLHPQAGKVSDDENDNSLVLKLEYSGTTILFTGDLEENGEKEVLSKHDIEADILKVGHHGSSTSSSKEFLEAVDATYAVIQCGRDNRYGHPHYEVLDNLSDNDVLVYRTDEDKSVSFYLTEKGIEKIETDSF